MENNVGRDHLERNIGMDRIWKHMDFLGLIANPASKRQVRALLSTSTEEQLNVISELALNVLQYRIKLSKYYKTLLAKDADFIRTLANRSVGSQKRRNLVLNNIKTTSVLLKVCLKRITDGR